MFIKKDLRGNNKPAFGIKKKNSLYAGGDFWFYFLNDALLITALLLVLYPILYVFSASFSSSAAVISNRVYIWPVDFSLEGYKAVLKESRVWTGYANTIFYTTVGTIINLVLSVMCAYPLSRKDFVGRSIFMFIITFTMIFHGGMLPTYLTVKRLGLLNTRLAMLLPNAISVYNVIVMRTYYRTNISEELLDAAFLDGCDNFKFLVRIVIPLSAPITAVMVLFYAVGHWNTYFNAFIYLSNRALFPLQLFLREILIANQMNANMAYDAELAAVSQGLIDILKYSLIIVASLPIWCVYPFIQKYFVKGIMVGSIKG
jgi:multiple sugar transport system permease protein/putative aldouronate transport system permease protein